MCCHLLVQELCAGSLVLLRNSKWDTKKGDKMQPKWIGPYEVVCSTGKGVYSSRNPSTGKSLASSTFSRTQGIFQPSGHTNCGNSRLVSRNFSLHLIHAKV